MVKHPCIGICIGDDYCVGCGRTPKEQAEWLGYSDERKLEVLRRIESERENKVVHFKSREQLEKEREFNRISKLLIDHANSLDKDPKK